MRLLLCQVQTLHLGSNNPFYPLPTSLRRSTKIGTVSSPGWFSSPSLSIWFQGHHVVDWDSDPVLTGSVVIIGISLQALPPPSPHTMTK